MRTVAEYERIAYLDQGASGSSYDVPAALRTLAVQVGIPLRQINKMIRDGTLPVRKVMFGEQLQRTIMSEDVVAMISGLGGGKAGNALRLVNQPRGLNTRSRPE